MVENELITKVRTRNVKSILSNVFTASLTLANGNGTTANGSAVDLGGTLSDDVTISLGGVNDRRFRIGLFGTDNLYFFTKNYTTGSEIQLSAYDPTFTYSSGLTLAGGSSSSSFYMYSTSSGVTRNIGFDGTGFLLSVGSDAIGDTYYRNSSGYLSRLPVGTNGHVLTLAGGIPSWAAPSGGSGLTVGTSTITSGTNTRVLYNNSGVLGEYTVSGSGNVAMTTSPTFTTPNIGTATGTADGDWHLTGTSTLTGAVDIVGTSSNTIKHTFNSLGVTQTNGAGLHFRNTTAAAAGAQQMSPSIVLEGNGWKTNATAASQSVKYIMDVLPVQGAANPTGTFRIGYSINGAATTYALSFDKSNSYLSVPNLVATSGTIQLNSSRIILFNGGLGSIRSDANTGLEFRANSSSTVVSGGQYRFYNINNYTATSGTQNVIANETGFAPTSGTAVFNAYLGSGTINQTGGANGVVSMFNISPTYTAAVTVYGIRYNPTVTSVTNHYFINASSGRVLLGGLPTSAAGLSTGELWSNAGVINIV